MPERNRYPYQNRILAVLPANEYALLHPQLEWMTMKPGTVLIEAGKPLPYVYFPVDCIVSLMYQAVDGSSTEVGLVGMDGIVGVPLFMGGQTTPSTAIVQSEGQICRLRADQLMNLFNRAGETQHLLLRYTQALLTQMSQTAVCNRHHTLERQLCRWLLTALDRLPSNWVNLTQESIAHILGVRREGVTAAACKLQMLGLIEYHRGHIVVLDRPGLMKRSCECYAVVRQEYDRLLPEIQGPALGTYAGSLDTERRPIPVAPAAIAG